MALVIEDGTGVVGANTYVTIAGVRDYAAARGITIPAADSDVEPHVHLAMDWFEQQELKGVKTHVGQPLKYPRSNVMLDGVLLAEDEIPSLVIRIVCEAAVTSVTIPLQMAYAGTQLGAVKMKKLDVMQKEFFAPDYSTRHPTLVKLNAMLLPIIGSGLGSGRLTVNRV